MTPVTLVRIDPVRDIAASKALTLPSKRAGPWRVLFHAFLLLWLVCFIARVL